MDLIDVTLRDGGHAVNFDWPTRVVEEYYDLVSSIDSITYVEMGYWKQTAKSNNRFYNLDMNHSNGIQLVHRRPQTALGDRASRDKGRSRR